MSTPIAQGWQCPCCKVVYAPSVMKCECCKVQAQKPTTTLPEDLKEKVERFREEMSKGAIRHAPIYPPSVHEPITPYLDPTTRPMCEMRGETPMEKRFSTLPQLTSDGGYFQ